MMYSLTSDTSYSLTTTVMHYQCVEAYLNVLTSYPTINMSPYNVIVTHPSSRRSHYS